MRIFDRSVLPFGQELFTIAAPCWPRLRAGLDFRDGKLHNYDSPADEIAMALAGCRAVPA